MEEKIKIRMISGAIFIAGIITSHFGKNPSNGGAPARDIIRRMSMLSWGAHRANFLLE